MFDLITRSANSSGDLFNKALLLLYPIEQIFRRAAKQIHKASATQT
ncbi:MAG: hypothetical protein JJU48_00145 [Methylophaga sp.]|nr:hypothetical protein [Methylophaga sp.]